MMIILVYRVVYPLRGEWHILATRGIFMILIV